jgi:hypothetical protein
MPSGQSRKLGARRPSVDVPGPLCGPLEPERACPSQSSRATIIAAAAKQLGGMAKSTAEETVSRRFLRRRSTALALHPLRCDVDQAAAVLQIGRQQAGFHDLLAQLFHDPSLGFAIDALNLVRRYIDHVRWQ